ncbi:MAG: hypothetical protein ACE3JK_01695 [Sporolactobacillus sp.]
MLVQNKGEYVRNIGVRLIPGVNRLSGAESKLYAEEVKHPLNKYLVEHGEIAVVSPGDISSVSPEKAVLLVNDTFDLGLLDQFTKDESVKRKNKTILNAITVQIESIKNPPKDKVVNRES